MVDYRASSYKKIASRSNALRIAAARKKSEEQKTSTVSINPANISSGLNQVAVSGNISENVIVTTSSPSSSTSSQASGSTTESVSADNPFLAKDMSLRTAPQSVSSKNPYVATNRTTQISGSVVAKLAREQAQPQSVRSDIPYEVGVSPREKTRASGFSVDVKARTAAEKRELYEQRVKNIYEASPLASIIQGTKNLFKKEEPVVYSDITGRYSKGGEPLVKANVFGFSTPFITTPSGQASYDMGILGGTFVTGKSLSPLSNKEVKVFSDSKVTQIVGEKESVSVVRFAPGETVGTVTHESFFPRFNFKYGFYKEEPFKISGVVVEKAKFTGKVGEVSKADILSTKQVGRLLVKSDVTGKTNLVKISSKGGEVGGIGNKITTVESGQTTLRTESIGDFVERYKGKFINPDTELVGVVSKRGQTVAVIKKEAEINLKIIKGGESVVLNKNLFNVKSAGESSLGSNAKQFSSNILNKLIKEQPVRGLPKSISTARVTVGEGLIQTQTKVSPVVSLIPENIGKQAIQSVINKPSSVSKFSVASGSVSLSNLNILDNSKSTVGVVSSDFVFSQPKIITRQKLLISSPVVVSESQSLVGQSLSSRSSLSFKNKLNVVPKSSIANKLVVSQGNMQANVLIQQPALAYKQSLVQKQSLKTETVNVFKSSPIVGFRFTPSITPPPPPVIIAFPLFNLKKKDYNFNVDVKSFGKFKNIGKGLTFGKAISLGKSFVGNTASATFKVTKGGIPIKGINLGSNFYTKSSGEVIEKPRFRIKSMGELSEITFKGLRSQRLKL